MNLKPEMFKYVSKERKIYIVQIINKLNKLSKLLIFCTVKKPKPKKKRIWLYVDEDILEWVYEQMNKKKYANESHCFEKLVMEKIEKEKR